MKAARLAVLAVLLMLVTVAAAEPRLVEFAIRDGQLPKDQRVVRVRQGDEVTLRWTSDGPYTLHLHGYDLEAKVAPETPVSIRFSARASGRFPIEIHGARVQERTVGYLEVHPR